MRRKQKERSGRTRSGFWTPKWRTSSCRRSCWESWGENRGETAPEVRVPNVDCNGRRFRQRRAEETRSSAHFNKIPRAPSFCCMPTFLPNSLLVNAHSLGWPAPTCSAQHSWEWGDAYRQWALWCESTPLGPWPKMTNHTFFFSFFFSLAPSSDQPWFKAYCLLVKIIYFAKRNACVSVHLLGQWKEPY